MVRLMTPAMVAVLALGCSSGATPTPIPAPTPSPTSTPAPPPTPTPEPTQAMVEIANAWIDQNQSVLEELVADLVLNTDFALSVGNELVRQAIETEGIQQVRSGLVKLPGINGTVRVSKPIAITVNLETRAAKADMTLPPTVEIVEISLVSDSE